MCIQVKDSASHFFLTDWVYSLIRDLEHAVQTNATILLLIYCMYTLISDSVALTFAVNPSRAQKALEVGYGPFQLKESLSSPLLNSSWSLLSSQICPTLEPHSHEPKQDPKSSSSFSLVPLLSEGKHADWPRALTFSKTGFLSCFWGEFWKVWGKLHVSHTDRTWLGS